MRPYAPTKFSKNYDPIPSSKTRTGRKALRREGRKACEATEPDVHPAEIHLIMHDAGICPIGCCDEEA